MLSAYKFTFFLRKNVINRRKKAGKATFCRSCKVGVTFSRIRQRGSGPRGSIIKGKEVNTFSVFTSHFECGATRNRTGDTRIFSPLLYQLSYGTFRFCDCKGRSFFRTLQAFHEKKEEKVNFYYSISLFSTFCRLRWRLFTKK